MREAANWGETIILAVPYKERQNAIKSIGDAARNKPLIDVTNCVGSNMECINSTNQSGAEELQKLAKDARVVKAFNTVFAQHMSNGNVRGQPVSAFIAGDDEQAKREAMGLASAIGFEPIDTGPLSNARYLEALGHLNMNLGYKEGLGQEIGFHLLRPAGTEEPATVRRATERPSREESIRRERAGEAATKRVY